ncbi:MAG: metallophosphoesterase [Eubacteriales bacterium]|nr:metallophosphoesterase [Eubacteriales bacterium]
MINIRRTLRKGGRTTIQYTRKAVKNISKGMTSFESFVETEDAGRGTSRLPAFLRNMTFTSFFTIAIVVLFFALMIFSNSNIVLDEQTVTIVGGSSDFEGFSILHLSDLHGRRYGEKQENLLRAVEDLDYDMVVFTGDMVGASGDPEPFYELLEGLGDSEPIYFIAGDSDPGPLLDSARDIVGTLNEMVLEDWILGAMRRGAVYLNKPVSMEVGSSTLWLTPASMLNINADIALEMAEYELDLQKDGVVGGIGADYTVLPFTNYRYRQISGLKEGALYLEEDDLHITLSHYPPSENALSSAETNAPRVENAFLHAPDLALCGHYCGGVWRLPFLGAFYIPDSLAENHGWLPEQSMVSGLRQSASTTIYTSAGLGVTDYGFFPDFRIMNSPQVSLITLTTHLTEDLLTG